MAYNNYDREYDVWGLGGCKVFSERSTTVGNEDDKATKCKSDSCLTDWGFKYETTATNVRGYGCICDGAKAVVNEYSSHLCRPLADTTC